MAVGRVAFSHYSCWRFVLPLGNKENKSAKPDSTKIDSAKGRSAEKKNSDALIEDTSLQPVSPQPKTSLPASAERQPQGVGSKPEKPTNQEKPQTVADDKPDAKKDEHIVSEIFKSRKGSPKEEKQTPKFNAKINKCVREKTEDLEKVNMRMTDQTEP